MAEIADHLEKLLGSWKALLPVLGVTAGAVFWFTQMLYQREIASLRSERDTARSDLVAAKANVSPTVASVAKTVAAGQSPVPGNADLELIAGRAYVNERIILDGKHFERCSFTNVTLVYNGGRYVFKNNTVNGGLQLASDNLQIDSSWQLLFNLGFLKFDGRNEFGPIAPTNPVPAEDAK